ncbi:hypothetical protein LTR17_007649 [Elasticomyces elasticus]|nr:hypothetical protein LTR17_007649 [Elasticomyces elasticus]
MESSASQHANCPILRLPRELRNQIYSFVVVPGVRISDRINRPLLPLRDIPLDQLPRNPRVTAWNVVYSPLLRVNRQIHDEYLENNHLCAALGLDLPPRGLCQPYLQSLSLENSVPSHALAEVKVIIIMLHWTTVMHVSAIDEVHNFWSTHTQEELAQQRNIAWTPSKELRKALVHFLGVIRSKVHSTAQVIIRIDLSDIPVPSDPLTWAPDARGADATTTANIAQMFHKETIFGLGQDMTLTWPRRLMVEGYVEVPLWCSMASNSAEVRSSRREWDEGEADRIVLPRYKESAEKLQVRFDYVEGEDDWRGFKVMWVERCE